MARAAGLQVSDRERCVATAPGFDKPRHSDCDRPGEKRRDSQPLLPQNVAQNPAPRPLPGPGHPSCEVTPTYDGDVARPETAPKRRILPSLSLRLFRHRQRRCERRRRPHAPRQRQSYGTSLLLRAKSTSTHYAPQYYNPALKERRTGQDCAGNVNVARMCNPALTLRRTTALRRCGRQAALTTPYLCVRCRGGTASSGVDNVPVTLQRHVTARTSAPSLNIAVVRVKRGWRTGRRRSQT
ncbi:hypothetical protein SKAU_G00122310 [Synaphobranchus kaupii]|uniref:Uncharacterized protein n=1 Tax=Synaphobranchus kaupii TaxID=118154 RepID=A0A9Q1FNT7_SYNKA|nr:hypothetical protein SKAU_G00122310 [Synaphobranchus kaupii]